MNEIEANLPLGKTTVYASTYDARLLCPVPRQLKRDELCLGSPLPFHGVDIWNAYEISWLDLHGKPVIAMGEFRFACESACLVESKSFKLYLNSFNQTRFADFETVRALLSQDLTGASGAPVDVRLIAPDEFAAERIGVLPGRCIDDCELVEPGYDLDPALLAGAADPEVLADESLHSHLLKSNCLVTRQPDWASVLIRYRGPRIDPAALLRYLVSFRQHNEFHEQCVERIFADLMQHCQPQQLSVYARYTRRGGLDINPFRSNFESEVDNVRLARQ